VLRSPGREQPNPSWAPKFRPPQEDVKVVGSKLTADPSKVLQDLEEDDEIKDTKAAPEAESKPTEAESKAAPEAAFEPTEAESKAAPEAESKAAPEAESKAAPEVESPTPAEPPLKVLTEEFGPVVAREIIQNWETSKVVTDWAGSHLVPALRVGRIATLRLP
jgi:hypothetical protein